MTAITRLYPVIEQVFASPLVYQLQGSTDASTLLVATGTLERVGLVGQLLLFIWLLYTGRIRWGKDYDKVVEERDAAVKVMQAYYTRIESKIDMVLQITPLKGD